ncbi:GbsR/MarR family transcriptional regulator [Paraliomyxa miuraensis]|uniref:GbsR/MarR family transcriptional regulator n=1 Tax=Paraliomyxa miuraensis TaxID=376150 RepID=UPI00224DC8EE|nr:MarR family transcriptional regulator [Paraliomyxa miuraensis]MCX4247584.1 MarR family transcriptional regulator [Paraliomyxa miuraensis]
MLHTVLSEAELQLCEAFGRLFEDGGSTRIAGRVVGWLMLCDPPHQTQAELVQGLGVSKASVSTELRQLELRGMVERITLPGDRRSYYRVAIDAWPELMARRLRVIDRCVALADEGLALLEHASDERRARLAGLRHGYVRLQAVMRAALEELRAETRAGRPGPASGKAGKRTVKASKASHEKRSKR